MMKSNRYFIRWVGVVLNPVESVAEQRNQPFPNLVDRNSKVSLSTSVFSRPFPRLVEHLRVQFPDVAVGSQIGCRRAVCERPLSGTQNVLSLPFIELLFRR